MHDTLFRKALIRLSRKHPDLRKKLARELFRIQDNSTFSKCANADKNYMLAQSLMKISERGPQILNLIGAEADELEDWQEFKIHIAAEYLDAVYDSLRYKLEEDF